MKIFKKILKLVIYLLSIISFIIIGGNIQYCSNQNKDNVNLVKKNKRRLSGDQFSENQESYAERFSLTNSLGNQEYYFEYNEEQLFVIRYIDIDRNNNLIRYSFDLSSYNVDSTLVGNEFILNDYLIDISEDIEEQYFYISFSEYLENDTDIRLYCSYGLVSIYDYENDYYLGSKTSRLNSLNFDVPDIFMSSQINYYINLDQNTFYIEEIERLEGIIEELETEISRLENLNRNLQTQNNTLTENNTNLQNQIIVLNQYKTQLETEVSNLQNNYNEIYSLYENLLIENEELNAENVRLEQEYQNAYNEGLAEGQHQAFGIINFLERILLMLDRILNVEILPYIRLWYIVAIPLILGVVKMVLSWFR